MERVSDRARQLREVARSSFALLQGPYTTAFLYEDPTSPYAYWLPISQRTVLAIGAVYASLAHYADLIGTMPVRRLRGDSDERLPLPSFVTAPAGEQVGWIDEVGQLLWSLLLRGDAFALPTSWDFQGYPATFVVTDPDQTAVTRDGLGRRVYRIKLADRSELELVNPSPTELLHIRWQRPPGAYCGVGILDVNAGPGSTLAGAFASEVFANEVMANPVPPAVLQHPLRLDKRQAATLQAQWTESTARRGAAPAVLSGGVTYQPLQVTPRDVQLIESRRWNATQIAVMFKLPPHIVGGSTGDSLTYSTVEGEMTRLWQTALMPMTKKLERHFGAWTPNGQRLRFVPDDLLRSQTRDRFEAHKIALDAGFETVAEVRALENLPPLPSQPTPPQPDEEESDE